MSSSPKKRKRTVFFSSLKPFFKRLKQINFSGTWPIVSLAVILLSVAVGISAVQQKQIFRSEAQTTACGGTFTCCESLDTYGDCIGIAGPFSCSGSSLLECTDTYPDRYCEQNYEASLLSNSCFWGGLEKTGRIWASSNICYVAAGENSCWTSVIWTTENVTSQDEVTLIISSEGGIRSGQTVNPSGAYGFDLKGNQGQYKAELRINSQAVDEVLLRAVPSDNYPTGNLTANPNPHKFLN